MPALKRLGMAPSGHAQDPGYSREQEQTKDAFSYKWSRRETYQSNSVKANSRRWLFERYCANDPRRLEGWLAGEPKIILDAGCGSGFSALLFFGDYLKKHDYLGVDISDAVDIARVNFKELDYPGDFLKMDILALPFPEASIDLIFSEGVLHHTDSTEQSIKHLARLVKPGGRFLFYVYRKKAVIREFTDDHIRAWLQPLGDEEAWNALEPLTRLGVALGELNIELDVPDDIPFLGIPKGKIDIQRFFYWNICKVFYRPEFSFDEMNHNNFDWFRPLNSHRQTPEEVRQWCAESALAIEHMDLQESGITVVAVKE